MRRQSIFFARTIVFLITFALLETTVACGTKDEPSKLSGCTPSKTTAFSFATDIQPLFASNCTSCHATTVSGGSRGGAPSDVNYDTYAGASQKATNGLKRIVAGTMPPSGGSTITTTQQCDIQTWIDAGMAP